MEKINLDSILLLQEEIIEILNESEDENNLKEWETIEEDLGNLYSQLNWDKEGFLSKIFWSKAVLKFKWYWSKRDILFEKYDNVKDEIKVSNDIFTTYLSKLNTEIDRINEYISLSQPETESDISYIRILQATLDSINNTKDRVEVRNTALSTVYNYMEDNRVNFRISFNNAFIENSWQKMLSIATSFNKNLISVMTDINNKQVKLAIENGKLAKAVEWQALISSSILNENKMLLEQGKKEILALNSWVWKEI